MTVRSFLALCCFSLLTACGAPSMGLLDGAEDASLDGLSVDATGSDGLAPGTDASADGDRDVGTDARTPELVTVSHEREFRGVWVATVYNINFPSRTGLSASAQQAELIAMLDTMVRLNLNAMVFQVRPEGDALYRSALEPWSRFLTGRQGGDPGYDPLGFLIEQAHRRGIEVHAWFNPYRAKVNASSMAVAPHISVTNPTEVVTYGDYLWMDPGSVIVQNRVVSVIEDVVRRYDIDGVHFDDYFYPYPNGDPFPDDRTWEQYRASGGTLSRADWRRDNVNRLIRRVNDAVRAIKDYVRFGISPFGIYRPGMPPGITGLDQYNAIYADPVRWISQGWVDYLAPQLYWPTTQTAQAYGPLLQWWTGLTTDGRYIFAGNHLSRLGSSSAWTVDEIRAQLNLSRRYRSQNSMGNIFFTIRPFQTNLMNIADIVRNEYYQRPALTPPLATMRNATLEPPEVTVVGRTVQVLHSGTVPLRAWVIYRNTEGRWDIHRIVPASERSLELPAGQWAITAASRHGVESPGVVVRVD